MSIIAYYRTVTAKGGKVAASITVYNDRQTCDKCLAYLPLLLNYLKIDSVTFVNKNGATHVVNAKDIPAPKPPKPPQTNPQQPSLFY